MLPEVVHCNSTNSLQEPNNNQSTQQGVERKCTFCQQSKSSTFFSSSKIQQNIAALETAFSTRDNVDSMLC